MPRILLYETGVDDTVGGYVSNYAIFGISIIGAIALCIQKPSLLSLNMCKIGMFLDISYKIVTFLPLFGFGHFFAGLVHQFWPHDDDYPGTPLGWHIVWRLSMGLLIIASERTFGMAYAVWYYGTDTKSKSPSKGTYVVIVLSILYVIAGVTYVMLEPTEATPTGIATGVSNLVLFIMCVVKLIKDYKNVYRVPLFLLAFGSLIQVIGLVTQVSFSSCGQVVIPDDCPLSESCNHNCVFHSMAAVGTIPFIFAAFTIIRKDKLDKMEAEISTV